MPLPKLPRACSEQERFALKQHTQAFVDAAGGPEIFAAYTRVEKPALSNYGSVAPDQANKFMPIDVAIDLARKTGGFGVLEVIVAMLGGKIVPLNAEAAADIGIHDLLDISSEAGDVTKLLATVVRKGGPDGLDRRELHREAGEAIAALQALQRKTAERAA